MDSPDTKAPYISKINPASGAKEIVIASDIVIEFSEPVVYGEGSIQLVNMSTGETLKIFTSDKQLNLNGSTLTINPSVDLAPGSLYAIYIDTGFVKDESNNLLEYAESIFYTLMVPMGEGVDDPLALPPQQGLPTVLPGMPGMPSTSQDTAPPTVTSFSPPAGINSVPIDTNLVITFSENIQFGAGEIVLQTSDYKVVETFRQNSSNVAISGNTLTINPSANFNYSTGYYVGFESNSVKDEAGNIYAGSGFSFTSDVRSRQAADIDSNFGFIEIRNLKIAQPPNAEINKTKITFDVYLDSSEINGKNIVGLFIDLNYNQDLVSAREVASISSGDVDVFSNISGGGDSVSNNEERVKQGKVLAISSLAMGNPNTQITDSEGKVLSITLYSSSLLNEFSVGFDQALLILGDGSNISAVAGYSSNININSSPIAIDGHVMVEEDTAKISTLTANDIDSASLTFAKVASPTHGTVVVSSNGSYTYTPNANFNGTDSFTFKANDGAADSAAATVSITVSAVNDSPVATAVSISTNEDTVKNGTLTATDVDSTSLTFSKVASPSNGTVTVNSNGAYTYTPNANFNGTDSFTFKANDGYLDSAAATVSVTVTPVNDAPVIATSQVVLKSPQQIWTKLLGSEGSDEANTVKIGKDGGIYVMGTGQFPISQGVSGNTYDAYLSRYETDGALTWLTRLGLDLSSGQANSMAVSSDGSIYVAGHTQADLDGQTNSGSRDGFLIKYTAQGTKVWTKLLGSNAQDEVFAIATDSDGNIVLAGQTRGGNLNSFAQAAGNGPIFASKFDPNGNVIWISQTGGNPGWEFPSGITVGADGSIYVAGSTAYGLNGQTNAGSYDTFVLKFTSVGQIAWTKLIGSGSGDIGKAIEVGSDGGVYVLGLTSTGLEGQSGVGGIDAFLTKLSAAGDKVWTMIQGTSESDEVYSLATSTNGSVYIVGYVPIGLDGIASSGGSDAYVSQYSGDGSKGWTILLGTPWSDNAKAIQASSDGYIYVVGASAGDLGGQKNANRGVTGEAIFGMPGVRSTDAFLSKFDVSNTVVLSAQIISTNEDTAKTGVLIATDVDSTSLTYSKVANPANGTVTVNSNGTYTYTPNANFNGTDTFTFKANDGAADSAAATVSITVSAVNDAPVSTAVSITTNEDTAKNGTLTATDVDSASLTFAKVAGPSNGTVTINTNGTYTYLPNANFNGSDSFTFKAFDGTDYSTAETVSITVNPVNDTPVGEIIYHGKFIEGQTISADISKITEPEGIGIPQYLWKRDSVIVKSGLSAYYTISDADIDHIVSVDVKYLDGGGTLEVIKGSDVNKVTALGDLRGLTFNISQNSEGVVVGGSVNLSQTFSKAKSISLLFWKEGDQQTWVNLSRDSSGLFVFEQKLDKYASSGSYAVRAIDAVDDFGASIRFTEQKMIELGYQTKSVLDNPYSDNTKPAIKSFEISNFHFNDQTQSWDVDYKLSVTDDKSGLKKGHIVEFLSPTGASLQEWRDFNSDGDISTTRSLSKYTASGIYKINTIRIWDIAGNDGTLGYVAINAGGLTSELTLNNPYADNKSPTLNKFTLAATFNSVTLRPSIVIDFSAADDVSGFKNSYIRMADINGVLEDRWIEDQDSTKAGVQFNLDLVQEYTSGKFKIQYLNLYDNANNSSNLVSSDLLKSGFTPEINVFFKPVGASDDYVIKAMDSDDWLIGSSSNDILDGGKGQDVLYSGPGNDYVSAGTGDDLIVGGEGAGNDTYVGGTGTDTVKYTSAVNTILVNLLTGLANGQDIGTDQLSQIENLIGGQTGDTLMGDNNANHINAYTGNDTITGNGGNDTIDGGEGQDTVVYGLNASNYTVTAITGGYQVVAKTGTEGTDTLLNVESLRFANKTVVAADFVAAGGEKDPAVAKFWKDNTKTPSDTKKADAVNLTDAIAILKMIVGLNVNSNNTALSPYQAIAADFDQSGDVGLTDAIGVLKMVVGLSAPTPTWKYYDDTKLASAYTSAQSLNPKGWTTSALISDTGAADSSVKLVGVLTGDVDGSWAGV